MNALEFKDLKIGVFVIFNNEYAVKINSKQILTVYNTIIEPDDKDELEIQSDCNRDIYQQFVKGD